MKNILFIITVCAPLFLFGGCISEHEGETHALEVALTQQYDLAELDSYIKNRNTKDAHFDEFAGILYYDELNVQFPVEIMRYSDSAENPPYTIYRVAQGGYYYVFWSWAYPQEDAEDLRDKLNILTSKEYMCAYFSAYIKETKSRFAFMPLKIGTSTAEDVKKIDPYFDFVSLSQGCFSYSLLDSEKVLKIKYSYRENTDSGDSYSYYESQIVDEISVVSIEEVPSCYRLILKQDLPF